MMRLKKLTAGVLIAVLAVCLCACVDQHPDEVTATSGTATGDSTENGETRIVATSYATLLICDKLGLDLVAIPITSGDIPEQYQDLPEVGTPMSPDVEAITMLSPTDIIGPDTLQETIEPT